MWRRFVLLAPSITMPSTTNISKSPTMEPYLFIHHEYGIFTSPNFKFPPPFPLTEPSHSLESTQSPCCSNSHYPFHPLVPTSPCFGDSLLGDLQLKPGGLFEAEKLKNGQWWLASDTVTVWKCTKNRLLFILHWFSALHEVLNPSTPTNFEYQHSHKSSEPALVSTKCSYLSFRVLMVHILWLVMIRSFFLKINIAGRLISYSRIHPFQTKPSIWYETLNSMTFQKPVRELVLCFTLTP